MTLRRRITYMELNGSISCNIVKVDSDKIDMDKANSTILLYSSQ